MWSELAHSIIKYRLILMITLGIITVFMGREASNVKWSYNHSSTVPSTDPDYQYFEQFKKQFGEDGNILAIGIKDSSIYEVEKFKNLKYLTDELARLDGVNDVLSMVNFQRLVKDDVKKKFVLLPVFDGIPENQKELDSLLAKASALKFYSGQVINETNGAMLILVTVNKEVMDSPQRKDLMDDILLAGDKFKEATNIDVRYAGLPYVRGVTTSTVRAELQMFLIISVCVTALILFLFFRSWNAVVFPMIIIGVIVVWVLGTLSLLDYQITLLTGLIPPIIVVIGIPNSVYLLNKYHQEYARHQNKMRALTRIIQKIGIVAFITNVTTAIGFLVLSFVDIIVLREFGIVAGINIMCTFIVSIILIPSVFSYLPAPSPRELRHLNFRPLDKSLTALDILVHRYRLPIFLVTAVVIFFAAMGMLRVEAVSYMVDDLPEDSEVKQDLYFFERNFSGVMPLEIVVNTNNKKGVQNLKNIRKINEVELFLDSLAPISQPVSVVSLLKAARQAFYDESPRFYSLPNRRDQGFILRYLNEETDTEGVSKAFVDSTGQLVRISLRVADIGSKKMDSLVNQVIQPRIDSIFVDSKLEAKLTGTMLLFIKGNRFLIENLQTSLLIAFCIIALIMAILFGNVKMIIISLIPNIIPLLITAGLMGYFSIPLKPSTALIFSIAFGISVDDSIHLLAKYRQELFANNFFVPLAVSRSLRETGASMIYTSIILFFGFVIFAYSDFGGTVALGMLTSVTLLMAMLTNLIVLPALLLTFDKGKRGDRSKLIDHYDEFYHEDEDEEIDLDLIEVGKKIPEGPTSVQSDSK